MEFCRLGYDVERDALLFGEAGLRKGDSFEVLIPDPTAGEWFWAGVRLEWTRGPRERWYLSSGREELNAFLSVCDPVGLFARRKRDLKRTSGPVDAI